MLWPEKTNLRKKIEGSDISEIFLVQIPQCVTALRRARRTNYNSVWQKNNPGKKRKNWFQNIFPTSIASSAAFCYPTIKNYLYNDDIHLPKNNKIIVIILNFMSDLINPKPNHNVAKNFLKSHLNFLSHNHFISFVTSKWNKAHLSSRTKLHTLSIKTKHLKSVVQSFVRTMVQMLKLTKLKWTKLKWWRVEEFTQPWIIKN